MKKILAVTTIVILLFAPLVTLFSEISDAVPSKVDDCEFNYIGYGINALSYDPFRLDDELRTKTRILSSDVDQYVLEDGATYTKKQSHRFSHIEDYSESVNSTLGIISGVEVGTLVAYVGVKDTLEVGGIIKNSSTDIYEIFNKDWTIHTKTYFICDDSPALLSSILSDAALADIQSMNAKYEAHQDISSDINSFFQKYGTHINTGYHVGGKTNTTYVYTANYTGAETESFVRNTVIEYAGLPFPQVPIPQNEQNRIHGMQSLRETA